jgi:hypothetical protein
LCRAAKTKDVQHNRQESLDHVFWVFYCWKNNQLQQSPLS